MRSRESEEVALDSQAISLLHYPLVSSAPLWWIRSPSMTSSPFSAPFFPLDIRQKAGKQAKQGEKSAHVEYEFDARMISKPAKDR